MTIASMDLTAHHEARTGVPAPAAIAVRSVDEACQVGSAAEAARSETLVAAVLAAIGIESAPAPHPRSAFTAAITPSTCKWARPRDSYGRLIPTRGRKWAQSRCRSNTQP
jgi:hypothetical protein